MSSTAPVEKNGFSHDGELFVEATGQNRHRRASIAEIREHFRKGNEKDHPAHWFEAQCIHYGLKPSKTKAVARMRLLDASNDKKFAIPNDIVKLEAELKKEWTKKKNAAKRALTASTTTSATAKRKRVSIPGSDVAASSVQQKSTTVTKKARSDEETINVTVKIERKATKETTAYKTAKCDTPVTASSRKAHDVNSPNVKASAGATSLAMKKEPTRATPGRQTARRGDHFSQGNAAAGRRQPAPDAGQSFNDFLSQTLSPSDFHPGNPPVSDEMDWKYEHDDHGHSRGPASQQSTSIVQSIETHFLNHNTIMALTAGDLTPLGLLNGHYFVECPHISQAWANLSNDDFSLVLTIEADRLWGQFNFGVFNGILIFAQRPRFSSLEEVPFTWRGRDYQGRILSGNFCHGDMTFLGQGLVRSRIFGSALGDYFNFTATRANSHSTRSPVDARTMRAEWDGY